MIAAMAINRHKAAWARAKAEDLYRQAREVEQLAGGGWRQRSRARAGACRLRRDAERFARMARQWEGDEAA